MEIPPANGERVYVPVKSTVVLDPPPRRTGDRAFAEGHGSDQPAGKVARRRLRARLKGGDGASFSAGFETGYDHGKDSKSQADAVASTASTANKIGRSHADAGGGKGDAGGDGACVTERVEAIVVAACRFQNSGARAFCTLVPIRPRRRGERRSLRPFPGVSMRPPLAFNPRPRRLSTLTDAFQLHPELVYTTFSRAPSRVPFAHDRPGGRHHERRLGREVSDRRVRARVRGAAGVDSVPAESGRVQARCIHRSPYDRVGVVNAVP